MYTLSHHSHAGLLSITYCYWLQQTSSHEKLSVFGPKSNIVNLHYREQTSFRICLDFVKFSFALFLISRNHVHFIQT